VNAGYFPAKQEYKIPCAQDKREGCYPDTLVMGKSGSIRSLAKTRLSSKMDPAGWLSRISYNRLISS
jgi:hypothetical protein